MLIFAEQKKNSISWIDANKLCKTLEGSLPNLVTRQYQQEILGVLKSVHILSIVEALFIGLTLKVNTKKVRLKY